MGIFTQKRRMLLQVLGLVAFFLMICPASQAQTARQTDANEKSVFGLNKIEAGQVISQIIELPSLEKFLTVNNKTEKKQLAILSYPVQVPSDLTFATDKEISILAAGNAPTATNYLNFRTF